MMPGEKLPPSPEGRAFLEWRGPLPPLVPLEDYQENDPEINPENDPEIQDFFERIKERILHSKHVHFSQNPATTPSARIDPVEEAEMPDYVSKELLEERTKRLEDKIDHQSQLVGEKLNTLREGIKNDIRDALEPLRDMRAEWKVAKWFGVTILAAVIGQLLLTVWPKTPVNAAQDTKPPIQQSK